MKRERKMAMVIKTVKLSDEGISDISFWLGKTVPERLAEVSRLRRQYFTWANGSFPDKIEKVVSRRKL